MANNNLIKTRIKQKIDSFSNWITNDPILLQGEIGIVQGDYPKIKIGDGVSKFSQLPYSNNNITVGTADSLSTVSDLSIITVTPEEYSEKLNSGISDNQLYIVSSDYLYGFDNPIKYVGDGTEATDAATVGQLSNYIQDLSSSTDQTIQAKLNSYLPISGGNITSNLSVSGTLSSKTSAILSVTKATRLSTTYLSVQNLTGLSASGKNLCNIISTELDKRSAVYVGNNQELSLANNLSIRVVSPEDYAGILVSGTVPSNEINIVSADYLYAYGKPINYVADGILSNDAATVNQLSLVSSQIQNNINQHTHSSQYLALSGGNITGTLSVKQLSVSSITNISVGGKNLSNLISSTYNDADQQLSNSLTTLIGQKSTIYVGANSSLLSTQELSIVKLTPEEYAEKLNAGSIPNNELDVISSDQLYGYDKPIKYVADGEENTDAATVGQLKNILSGITLSSSDTTECVRVLKLILQRFGGTSTI